MTTTTRFFCPIDDCGWNHEQPMIAIPEGATEEDLRDLGKIYNAQIEDVLLDHYGNHPVQDWVKTVSRLMAQLDGQEPLLCFGCFVDRHNARQTGQSLPPQNPAQLIVDGRGLCTGHVQLVDGPPMPDRTASGIVLPGQQIPPMNGQGLIGPNGGN